MNGSRMSERICCSTALWTNMNDQDCNGKGNSQRTETCVVHLRCVSEMSEGGYEWPETRAGESAYVSCSGPRSADVVRRKCSTVGQWLDVDYTVCTRPSLLRLAEKVPHPTVIYPRYYSYF